MRFWLFLAVAVALAVWWVAFAAPVQAPFSVTVLPSGVISCDEGPNAPAIPVPAQAAGFIHCALNADFTTNTTDSNGLNYGNPSTFLKTSDPSCQNSSGASYYMGLVFGFGPNGTPATTFAPCNHAQIVTDGSFGQALQLIYTQADQASYVSFTTAFCGTWPPPVNAGCANKGPRTTALMWPAIYNDNSNNSIPETHYVEFNFRVPQASETINTSQAFHDIILEFWNNQWTTQGISPMQWEGAAACATPCNGMSGGGGMGDSATLVAGPSSFGPTTWDQYNVMGFLVTSNGTNTALCLYLGTTSANVTRQNCWEATESTGGGGFERQNAVTMWVGDAVCFNDKFGAPGCITANPVAVFLKSLRVWTCSAYKTTACIGGGFPLITSERETTTRFAFSVSDWLSR